MPIALFGGFHADKDRGELEIDFHFFITFVTLATVASDTTVSALL